MFAALLTTVLFAISAVSAGRSTKMLGGIEANFWRISLATLVLGVWAHTFGNGLSGQAFPWLMLSGVVGFGVGDLALYQALPRLGSRLCMILVHCTAAPFAAVVERVWLGTVVTPAQMICALLILAGVAIALAPDHRLKLSRAAFFGGASYGLIAGFGQGLGAVLSRKAYAVAELAGERVSTPTDGITAAYQRILAGWVIGAASYVILKYVQRSEPRTPHDPVSSDPRSRAPSGKWKRAWPWVVSNALAGPAIGVSCFQLALATTPTAIVLPVVAMTPLVVIPFARVTEGDKPGMRSLLGGVLAVAGVALLTWIRFRP